MNAFPAPSLYRCVLALGLAWLVLGCSAEEEPRAVPVVTKKVPVSSNVTLEVQSDRRRVLMNAVVCQREGALELVLTHQGPNNKSHEALLSANVEARDVYEALVRANAKPGAPVQFEPEFREARGQTIKISFQYEQDGKQHTVPAQSWLRSRSGQPVDLEWVFGGSRLFDDALDGKKKQFLAQEEGTLIGLGISEAALLDVNIRTGQIRSDLDFDFWTDHIPPLGTKVTIILEPVGEYKSRQK